MDWDDPMLRDLAQLGPSVGARDGPGPLNPVAVIRALRAQRDPRDPPEAQPAPEERRSQSPTRRARRSSRTRSNSPRESRSKSRSKSPWKTYWNPKEESKTRFLRSTRSAKLERRFPEEAVIWQELSPISKAQRGENTRGISSEAGQPGRRPPSASALSRQDKSPQSRDWETVPPKLPVNWDSTGRRYASHNDLISEPLLGEMLLDAAAKGDVLQVRGILDQAELDQQNVASVLASRDLDDRTPLHWAARQGHLEVSDLLLRKKADALSTSGPPLATPLMLASLHGHAGVVRRLLGTPSASKQLQSCDAKGRNALHLACCSKSQVLQLLLHVQPELLHSQDKLGRNPLYYALGNPVPEEQWEILNTLLLGKCCAHQVDYLDRSPLWYAVHAGAVNSTALMLRLSPDRPPEVATSSKTRHDLERPKPESQPKPEEPKAEEKKDKPKPDAKPEEPKAEEKKDEPKPDAKPEESKTVPALQNVPHALALETPRSYVDPVPVLKTVTESGSAEATAVAKELQELLEQHKYLNPQTAHVRHPLHGWVSRCSHFLADSKVAEAKVCLARVTTGLNTDMTRISTAFRRFDMDESKHLDETEIMRLAAYLGVDVNPKDLDHNTDGEISLSEFQDFVGRMGGIQQLFEQRRRRVAETRRDTLSMAGVAIGARVLAHFYAGVKPDRYKSPEPEEAVVLGVHYKDDDMAGPSQLEVELEFLRQDPTTLERTKKATCVPSHWIVSTSEDAEVAAALREVGIHDEDQPFWDAVFPASETREVVRLTTCQRRALALVRAQATYLHQAAYPRVLERFQKMGYTDKELQAVLSWVQDLAPVIIHVQLDTVGRFLESDEFYRSQFETKTSNGALDDGNNIRIGWEEDLFGDAYHDATPFERCKYGALNVTNDFEGCKSAIQYGDSYLVLKDVRLRCSFAATDSGGIEGSRLAVLDKYAHVLEEYQEHEIQGILDVAMAPEPRAEEELPKLMRGSTENSIKEWLTFGFPQLKRKEGCFFFEVELKEGCILPHVGLAGDQFMWTVGVKSVTGIGGIGDDEYSCGVDGLHGACLKNGPVSSWNVSWPKGSVERVHFDCDNYEREQSEILGKTVLVGVLVDLDHGTVTFASDGAWGSSWKPHITQEDMPCYHEGLFPAISIKGSASFHFGPDFKHPPPKSFCDFTPWAKLGEVRVDNPAVGCSDVLNIYKEAQIHGEVCLKKHVLRLVANKRYRQQTRSWSIQVTGAGRCNGTYQWFDRFNKRSCYKSPSGCIIYYNQQESCWRINSRREFTGFVFQAKSKETSRYVSNMGGHSEPPRTGWKPALGLKGCVPVEIFQKALVQQGVPTEDLEHMIKVLRGTDEEKDFIFRKLGETTFKAEWHRLVWSPHTRPLSAAGAWAEVVRLAQSDILTKLGLSTSTAVVVSPQVEPHGTSKCLVSLGPREESDSTGVAFHVINLRGGDAEELALSSPSIQWRHAGPGAKAAVAIPLQGVRGWLGTDDPIPGIVVERGPGNLRRLQLDADALLRKDIFWPLQELGEAAEKPKSMSGRWSSGNGRCALKVDDAGSGRLWLLRNQTGPQERCLICQYDATERSLTGVAKDEANEAEEMKVSLTMSQDALTLTGTLGAQEMSFRRMTDAASFVWGSVNELGNSETSSLKRIVVNYRKGPKACEELQFTLDDRWPFTPIVLEAFKSPSGPAQDAKVRTGWYLDIVETFFYQRSDVFEEMAGDQKYLENLEEAHRQIHSLYDLLLRGLERTPLRLVFVNALEVDQLPEAEIQISGPLREQLGEVSETGALTGKGLQRSSPAFLAGVRAGWQVNVERSLQQTQSRLGVAATEGSAFEDSLKFLLETSGERVLCFSMDSRESLEVQVSTTSCETVQFSGADSVMVRCDTCRTDNAAGRYLLVLSPTGGEYGIPNKDQLQKLAEAWEESCDRLFGLKGEEVSVERDAWDEVRLRALCAHHGWEFSWMTEDDERRRRIAKGCGN